MIISPIIQVITFHDLLTCEGTDLNTACKNDLFAYFSFFIKKDKIEELDEQYSYTAFEYSHCNFLIKKLTGQ